MDRRSWLWRRKSSEKSPSETECSASASLSSLSERFSDDQACLTHTSHSPEVTSEEVVNDNLKALTDKLSAALLTITAKEDLIKQHAKVAEEAVSGWEKAEKEVLTLREQHEAAMQKSKLLEDQASHLDGALKECVRQLRQARQEQEQRIHEAVSKKRCEWESTKFELESQLGNLQKQLQSAKTEAAASVDKLEAAEKENSTLKLELVSRFKELELRIIERDLSTKAAETASKQHLESIKKLAKLDGECRRLKSAARKAVSTSDRKSFSASSICVEPFADSQSDIDEKLIAVETDIGRMSGLETNEYAMSQIDSLASALVSESNQFKNEKVLRKKFMVPSAEINLMDDFLEMERLAALPGTESRNVCLEVGPVLNHPNAVESSLKTELEAVIHKNAELEEKLEMMEAEKRELEMGLSESEKQLETERNQLREVELELLELQTQLQLSYKSKQAVEVEIKAANAAREMSESILSLVEAEMKTQLTIANRSKQAVEEELKATKAKKEEAESRLRDVEKEMKTVHSKVVSLEEEISQERALSDENFANFQKSEDELLKMKPEANLWDQAKLQHLASSNAELKILQEKELALAANRFAECKKTIASLSQKLRSLATLEDFLIDSEKPLGFMGEVENGGESWNLDSSELTFVK